MSAWRGKTSRNRTTNLKAYRDNPFWDKKAKEESVKNLDKMHKEYMETFKNDINRSVKE